jgi:hypothetical protein
MKFVIALLILVTAIGAYLYFHPDVTHRVLRGTPLERQPATTRLYKWRGPEGQWRYTDEPPPAGTPYEALDYREDTNVLPRPEELKNK